ncbi:MAG: type II and III secretion system protein family protein [Hellea sp.]
MKRTFINSVCFALTATALVSSPATAKSWVDNSSAKTRVAAKVVKDDMVLMRTEAAFKEVRVANADIADVVVLTDKSFQVMGKASGKTNVMLYDAQKRLVDIVDVTVGFDMAGLKKSLFETFPRDKIDVRNMAGGVYLSGEVANDSVSRQAEKIAEAYAPKRVTNGLSIRDSHQVMLEVRFVEATRDVVKELGIGLLTQRAGDFGFQTGAALANPVLSGVLQGGFGRATLDASIEALEEKGVIRTLAEPNLVSMSGETASFLAGGEFPIPVQADLGQVTIEFRQFGVGLSFTPTVLDDGIINLKVAPEVSQLDNTNSVRVGGVEVPALRVRRANTTIELRNSQSFAIAGLLQNESSNRKTQTPWIGDVPILGSLFRSTRYQKAETELVIIVTPRLVQPVSDISELASPLDRLSIPGDMESFIGGALEGPVADSGGLSGSYGYARE